MINDRRLWLQCSKKSPWDTVQTWWHIFNMDRKAILRGSAPRRRVHLQDPAPSAREIPGKHIVLSSQRIWDQSLPPIDGSGVSYPGSCDQHKTRGTPSNTYYLKAQGQHPYQYWSQHFSYSFLFQTQVLQENYCLGVSGQSDYFTQPQACSWEDFHFCHSFLIVLLLC
jgi:hypothetical protein